MKLIKTFDREQTSLLTDWSLYELDEAEIAIFHKKYAVVIGIFSDITINEYGSICLLKGLNPWKYEGFFDTEKESFQHIKILELKSRIDAIKTDLEPLMNVLGNEDLAYHIKEAIEDKEKWGDPND